MEGRLRGVRGGSDPVPAPVRSDDREAIGCASPRHADEGRGIVADADAALRREPDAPAVLDTAAARLRRSSRGRACAGRHRARTLGRYWPARGSGRGGGGKPRDQRARRDPGPTARPAVPGGEREPARRRAHPRPARAGRAPHRRSHEPAVLRGRARRGPRRRGRVAPHRLSARAPGQGRSSGGNHRREPVARQPGLGGCLCAASGARDGPVHRGDRRPRVRAPRHQRR